MKVSFSAFAALALTGCSSEAPPSAISANIPPKPIKTGSSGAVSGEYIITSVDGAPPVINIAGHDASITIDQNRIHFQSQCIYADWTYRRNGVAISTEPYYEPGSAMCARGLAPGEVAIQAIITDASTV